mmetsp:Transcript_28370/g.82167  ORF Transcript_28370/g.82167 Transcript_28370/m.82167 type:complete len:321 (+) Transcript_28370:82-1044(+)
MAQAVAARGPLTLLLQTSSGQYLALGLGVYALFPEQVKQALAPLLGPGLISQFGEAQHRLQQQAPIIIQTPPTTIIHGSSSQNKSLTTVLIYSVAGAGACWVGYIVCSQLLPDAVSEFMPVTKRLFKQTSETLGKGILQVKEILEEQIAQLLGKQEALEKRQEETHQAVKDVHSELGEARLDMVQLQNSLDRCEAGLDHSNRMQSYTLRGIKLLVRCVTSFLPDESNFIDDISRYIEDGGASDPLLPRSTGMPEPRPVAAPKSIMHQYQAGSMPTSLPHPTKVFVEPTITEAPSITSIDSEEDMSPNHFSMGDIRALLGH